MDEQAQGLLATLKKSSVAIDTKLAAFNNLKSSIKHLRVPDTCHPVIFECIKLGISAQTSPTLASTAFSTLSHYIKRLSLQEQANVITAYTPKLLPIVQDRLGDARENLRNAASQALEDLWPYSKEQVDRVLREGALGGNNAKAKEVAMMWVVKMNRKGLQFKGFVPSLVACLEDSDGGVRDTAKDCVVELFRSAPERAKNDLKKQMVTRDVRRTIMSFIVQHLGMDNSTELDLGASVVPTSAHAPLSESIMSEHPAQEGAFHDPLFVHSARELEDAFRDMQPPFEGRETEHNWLARDKNITKIRRLLQGNAPTDHHTVFMAGIKSMLDNIIRFTNTLRTTPSTNACQLCQELYRTLGTAMDPMTEMMIQNFAKMSAATKNITAKQADVSMETILSNCSYSSRVMQHIWMSFQEKNMQTRSFAPGWLKIIMKKGASHKSHIEHAGGLELIEKCLKKGLEDASPKVRESTRNAYWTFAQIWHNQAERFIENLDAKMRLALEKDPSNPNKNSLASSVSSITSTKSKAGPSVRPSVRDAIAAQRRAALQNNLPERPSSAQSSFPSTDASTPSTRHPIRPAGAVRPPSGLSRPNDGHQASSANRTITAGPVRRPKRPEINRPATADPYAVRNAGPTTQVTPTISPHTSPNKNSTATKATAASVARVATNKTPARTPATMTPAIRGKPRAETVSRPSPRQQAHARINSMPMSPTPKEENLTLVLPHHAETEAGSPAEPTRPMNALRLRDSDVTMASDGDTDGFTMVIPNLRPDGSDRHSPARPTSSGTPQKSGLPRRSPMKGANENAKPGSPLVQRYDVPAKPQSPDRSRLAEVPDQTEAGAVQVYEDPFQADEPSATPAGPVKPVLEEIAINERATDIDREATADLGRNIEGQRTPRGHSKTTSTGSILGANNDSTELQSSAEIMKSKRLLNSAIERVRAKSLDAHGFRRVQELVKTNHDIWGEDAHKYGELLVALLEYLEAPVDLLKIPGTPAGSKVQNLKTQVLATIRGMLALHRKEAGPYYARSLCSIISARRHFDDMSHITSEMEKAAEEICRTGPVSDCIDAILDLVDSYSPSNMSSTPSSPATSQISPRQFSSGGTNTARTINMSLQTLASLLAALSTRKQTTSPTQTKRLGNLAVHLLQDTDPEIRRADMEFCLALYERLGREVFWKSVEGAKESGLNLITYYLARRGKA